MAVYPYTSSPYTNPLQIDIRYKTLVSAFDEEGEENRKQKWLYPKRDVTIKYQALSKSEGEILWEFYCGRKGSYNSFSWIESTGVGNYHSYSSEYVATGDSTTLIFSLPAKGSSGATHNVNLDGVAVSTSDYGGLGPPSSTERITYDFEGRLKIRCRFADDVYSYENFYDILINSGVKLKGLLNL
jgi:hypothetical protein